MLTTTVRNEGVTSTEV